MADLVIPKKDDAQQQPDKSDKSDDATAAKHDADPAKAQKHPQPGQPPSDNPEDRATTFQPVEGAPELVSGEKLLVEAYASIWVILFVLLFLSWRRQRDIDARVAQLEGELQRARDVSSKKPMLDDAPVSSQKPATREIGEAGDA